MKTATILLAIFLSMHAVGQSFQFTIGTPDTVSLVSEMTPFPTTYRGGRVQCLFLASELSAAGLTPFVATQLNIDFVDDDSPFSSAILFVRVRNAEVENMQTLDKYFQNPPLNGLLIGATIAQSSFPLSLTAVPFTWDGASNVIVDLTFRGTGMGIAPRCYVDTGLSFLATRYVLDQSGFSGQVFTETFPTTATKGSWNVRPVITWTVDTLGVGIGEVSASTAPMQVFPNPTTDLLQVVPPGGTAHLEICDLSGRSIHVEPAIQETMMHIGIQKIPTGVYLVMAKDQGGNTIAHKRLLIAR